MSSQESATKFQLNLQIHRLTSDDCSKASSTWKKHGLESAEKLLNRKGVITWRLWAAISHHNNSTAMTKDTVKDQQRWEEIRRHSCYMQDALIQLASCNILPQQSSVEDQNVLQRLMGNCYFSVYKKSQLSEFRRHRRAAEAMSGLFESLSLSVFQSTVCTNCLNVFGW